MVYPILAAVAVGLSEGLLLDEVIPALESLPPTPGRLEPLGLGDSTIILRDDCKATLESVESALDFLSKVPAVRRGVVLGDMPAPPGETDPLYEQLGERIAQFASFAVFLGDTPAVHGYLRGARRGELEPEQIVQVRSSILGAAKAIHQQLRPGDVVLVKGRYAQRLERVVLALVGRTVLCDLPECRWSILCEHCPMLERGWR
jgi:UDP-N-acetylmuramyl pentapeptide synthase